MKKVMTGLRFIFRNGETWTIKREYIGDLWIKQVTTSYGRIGNSDFQEIHPCESLRYRNPPRSRSLIQVTSIWADLSKACSIALLAIKTSKKWISCTKMRITQNPTSSLKSTASISLTKHWTLTDSTMNTNLHSFHPKTNYIS